MCLHSSAKTRRHWRSLGACVGSQHLLKFTKSSERRAHQLSSLPSQPPTTYLPSPITISKLKPPRDFAVCQHARISQAVLPVPLSITEARTTLPPSLHTNSLHQQPSPSQALAPTVSPLPTGLSFPCAQYTTPERSHNTACKLPGMLRFVPLPSSTRSTASRSLPCAAIASLPHLQVLM